MSIFLDQLVWSRGFTHILPWCEPIWAAEDEETQPEVLQRSMKESEYRLIERRDWEFLMQRHHVTFTVDLAPEVWDEWALQHVQPDVWVFDSRAPQCRSWSESLKGAQDDIVGVEKLVREIL